MSLQEQLQERFKFYDALVDSTAESIDDAIQKAKDTVTRIVFVDSEQFVFVASGLLGRVFASHDKVMKVSARLPSIVAIKIYCLFFHKYNGSCINASEARSIIVDIGLG